MLGTHTAHKLNLTPIRRSFLQLGNLLQMNDVKNRIEILHRIGIKPIIPIRKDSDCIKIHMTDARHP